MLRFKLIDNVHPAFAADNFIIGTDFLNTGTHFHADHPFRRVTHCLNWLTFAIGDSALRKIVRGQLDRHAIPGDDADKMLPHLAGDMSYNFMAILEFYAKLSPWKGLDNCSGELDYFLVNSHKYNNNSLYHLVPQIVKSYFLFDFFLLLELPR